MISRTIIANLVVRRGAPGLILAAVLAGACHAQLTGPPLASSARGANSLPAPQPAARQIIGVPSAMLPVEPGSRSLILRATHIVSVRVEAVQSSPWTPRDDGGGEERTLSLTLRLEHVFKGQVDQRAGDVVRIDTRQRRLGFNWRPMPGVWSNVTPQPGTQLVGFSIALSHDARLLLTDPAAVELLPAESALADVALIARGAPQSLADTLAAARREAPLLGNLFADYLWATHREAAMQDFAVFDAILRAIEWPELNTVARLTLLMSIPDTVLGAEPPATRHIDRLAASMVRILQLPEAQALHDNILGTFLPNLVDASEPASRPPASVLARYPDEFAALRRLAAAHAQDEPAAALVAWAKR